MVTTLDDSRWDPYYAPAEVLDIPGGVHLGEGSCCGSK